MTDTQAARGKLYVVGTPIGNLADLSERAREALAGADVIAAEDTRRTRGLLLHIRAETPVLAYHEHNERERVSDLLDKLAGGATVALVSDAGTPLISDPGWRLVHAARAAGIDVVPIPGPSAVIVALCAAGLATDRFAFEGFLPRRASARAERLRELKAEPRTLVFFESVHRMPEALDALVEQLGADRPGALARELTKVHEQIVSAPLGELRARLGGDIPLLGEFVIVVAGAPGDAPLEERRAREIYELLSAEIEPSKALKLAAAITGLSRNDLYRLTRT
ncbi:MAG TPA: 16S rRNA (cytidine(1402)-2'-O)-methyltransferase [Gammaproteobacteria bacterium]|nr:16S rRNA (cytidine(1402)-2'-O)-methyltransferase [Gammaproteobacteria bacterium]